MGVTGLWETIKPCGRTVSLASLRNKTLAVDISLWLHQATNGIHESRTVETDVKHLIVLFNRVCTLLGHGIKPVFVFDGIPPEVKRRTLQRRRALQQQHDAPASDYGPSQQSLFDTSQPASGCSQQRRGLRIGFASRHVSERGQPDLTSLRNNDPGSQTLQFTDGTRTEDDSTRGGRTSQVASGSEVQSLLVNKRTRLGSDRQCSLPLSLSQDILSDWKKEESNASFEQSLQALVGSSPLRRQPERSCRAVLFGEDGTKSEESKFESQSSVESHGTGSTLDSDDDEVQFISSTGHVESHGNGSTLDSDDDEVQFISSTKSAKKTTPRSTQSKTIPEDYLEITSVRKRRTYRHRKQQSAEVRTEKTAGGFRLITPCSVPACQPTKVFPMFAPSKKTVSKAGPNSGLSSPEKRKKEPSKVASPAKVLKLVCFVDLTPDSDVGENNEPATETDSGKLPAMSVTDEAEKTFTEEELSDDYWKEFFDPDPVYEPPLRGDEGGTDYTEDDGLDVPPSQAAMYSGSQFLSQPGQATRQKNGPSLPLPEVLTANYQSLLDLFGIPFLDSPGEAEAQCAFLESSGITNGTISDDGDVFLFGGQKVYRHFFSEKHSPEEFDFAVLNKHLEFTQDKLIAFGMLTGSDYADGVKGVGPVRALEILGEFGGEGLSSLRRFRDWYDSQQADDASDSASQRRLSRLQKSLLKHVLPDDFPNQICFDAYLYPEVDKRDLKLTWGKPDVETLLRFAMDKFAWDWKKADKALLPVRKNYTSKQMRMDEIWKVNPKGPSTLPLSQRMGKAVEKLKTGTDKGELPARKSGRKSAKRSADLKKKSTVGKKDRA
ncbi:putative DNA repair protein complementing XP-G cells-like protein [Hypsibius exemplaris]|uniref:DNA repair protein complementing XP-G cells-like protein n=1 Tax=Hypsibius exemplaris TaxID=2072580 RepID=A0A1W0WD62_HYPEX|nr:putative DNA repair protein complementing XP-G cells-like protein [Hypsibius exemplaris]